MTEKQVGKMEVAGLKMVRWALGGPRKDKTKNEYARGRQKLQSWVTNFGARRSVGISSRRGEKVTLGKE